MKFDKKNIRHWSIISNSGLFILIGLLCRFLLGKKKNRVIVYGHKLNGNLLALYNYIEKKDEFDIYYVTMDAAYAKQLKLDNVRTLKLTNLIDAVKIARSNVLINDHGSQLLKLFLDFSSMKFVDVWHGVPYKGWKRDGFSEQKKYHQIWVSSPTMREKYIHQYGFSPKIVKATGYARVDALINNEYQKQTVLKKFNIPKYRYYILFAPTWQQDVAGRSIIPFDAGEKFFSELNKHAKKLNALIIFRAHLNVGKKIKLSKYSNIVQMSHKDYPVAEEFLAIADMLISDWSSIVFDYLALKKPTIFIDVPAPFAEGFTFGPEFRFGPVVGNMKELISSIDKYIGKTQAYRSKYKKVIDDTIKVAYGKNLDGKSSKNCYKQLKSLINEKS